MNSNLWNMFIPMTLDGLRITLGVFLVTLLLSLPLSIPVVLLRMSKNKVIAKITGIYIYIMRGTPLLLQLMFIFYGYHYVPVIGYAFSRQQAILLAFVLNYAAYFAEIFRGGIQSIDQGQYEAAAVLGLSKSKTFRSIIFPQVFRTVLPSLSNEVITLIKDTSLVYILGLSDILKAAKSVSNSFSTFTPYIYVGILYLLITAIVTKLLMLIEKKADYIRS